LFFETYRLQLVKEEELKDKNQRLKQQVVELERRTKLLELTLVDKKKVVEKLRSQLAKLEAYRAKTQSVKANPDNDFEVDLKAFATNA